MSKKTVFGVVGGLVLAMALGWWLLGWYQQSVTDERLLERLEQLMGQRDWKVTAVRTDGAYVFSSAFVLHQGEVVRSSDATPGRTGAPHYIVKNGKFYSLIHDYEVFESRQTVPRAFIEADLTVVSTRPALSAALAAMRESFPLHYTLLFLQDREAFIKAVASGEVGEVSTLWRRESPDVFVRAGSRSWPIHIPQTIRFLSESPQEVKLELQFSNETGYAGPGPSVELTFTPVDNLDEALRFPADYVRVESW